jgi:hypothetical protein
MGKANASFEVKGPCPSNFWQTADGTLHFEIRDGAFSHVLLGDSIEPFRVTRLSAQAQLRAGKIEILDANVNAPDRRFVLSGTASLKREVGFKLTPLPNGAASGGYSITGTLAEPHVAPLAGTEQARLKSGVPTRGPAQ